MALAYGALQLVPPRYEARTDLALPADSTVNTEIGLILSRPQLADALARLSPEMAAQLRGTDSEVLDPTVLLRRHVTLTPLAGGTHVRLAATAGSDTLARTLAQAIATSYADNGAASATAQSLQTLPQGMPQTMPQTAAPDRTAAGEIALLRQRLNLAWENRVELEERAQRIADLIAAENFSALALEVEGLPGLGRRIDDLAGLESERQQLAVTFLPNHPSMRALDERIEVLADAVAAQAEELAAIVAADRDAARAREDGLRDELTTLQAALDRVADPHTEPQHPDDVDRAAVTGAIGETPAFAIELRKLPPPLRADIALALAGGAAFFGQIGLASLGRPNRAPRSARGTAYAPPAAPASPPVPTPDPMHDPVRDPIAAHNWLETVAAGPGAAIPAHWLGVPLSSPAPAPSPPAPSPAAPSPAPSPAPRPADQKAPEDPPRQKPQHQETQHQEARHRETKRQNASPQNSSSQEAQRQAPPPAPDPLACLDAARLVVIRSAGVLRHTNGWARDLVGHYSDAGKRVVLIDAASRRRGSALGISDLAVGRARFADIVHGDGGNDTAKEALIPWGRQTRLQLDTVPVLTLLRALSEVYDVVVVMLDGVCGGADRFEALADLVLPATPRPKPRPPRPRIIHKR